MDVRICGPNLSKQDKGSFHVHADGCADLRKYGPQYRGRDGYGGDLNGNRELLVTDATVESCVLAVYDNGIIDERVEEGQKREDAIQSLISDFWFAPCCDDLPHEGVIIEEGKADTFECWVHNDPHSFNKMRTDDPFDVVLWLANELKTNKPIIGTHIHIVAHHSSEYSA